jgi:DNA/RNA-binding domain of Phe-tRNA-synthetase-like protein
MNNQINISSKFHSIYPQASVGIMVLDQINNVKKSEALSTVKRDIESRLRQQYADKTELRSQATIQTYKQYYKQFKKSYVVLAQLKSVIFQGQSIPEINGLVQAMFMAELDNMLLTAGHDVSSVQLPVTIDLGSGEESYTLMNGKEQTTKANDMLMVDKQNVIASVIYGPDKRTQINARTSQAMFVVYTPAGVSQDQIHKHFADIRQYVKLFSPTATVVLENIY